MKRFFLLLLLGLGAIANAAEPNTITVTGVGIVRQAPDSAWVDIGVSTQHADISHAMAEMDAIIAAITDSVLEFNVPRENIQTTYFNVWETESYDSDEPQRQFYANHSMSILIADIDMLSYIVEGAIKAGANSINGIQFIVSDVSSAASDARALAMADAENIANELADLAGHTLGRIISVRETSNSGAPHDTMRLYSDGYGIEPGEKSIHITLEVVFAFTE